jgi:hypothetical protein
MSTALPQQIAVLFARYRREIDPVAWLLKGAAWLFICAAAVRIVLSVLLPNRGKPRRTR